MAQALMRRKGGCEVLGHVSVNGGTASCHTKCQNCGVTLSSTHSFTKVDNWNNSCTSVSMTATCTCGYTYTESDLGTIYTRTGNHITADCVTQSEWEHYAYDSDGQAHACPTWHKGSVNSSNHKGGFTTTSTSANCVTVGTSTTKCDACGEITATSTGSTNSNVHAGPINNRSQASTCKTQGYDESYCAACNATTSKTNRPLDSNNHEGNEVNGGTSSAHKKYNCCNKVTQDGSYHSYTYTEGSWDHGCSSAHSYCNYTATCSCGYYYTDKSYQVSRNANNTNPTCTTEGKYDYSVTLPDGTIHACDSWHTIAATGHDSGVDGGTASVHKKCGKCGATLQNGDYHDYTPETTIRWTKGTSKCTAVLRSNCSCGHFKDSGLTVQQKEYTPPNCTSAGTIDCYVSGYSPSCPTTHPGAAALGHSKGSEISDTATCTNAGVKTFKCSRCTSNWGTEPSSAKGHKSVNGGTATAHKKCERCGVTTYNGSYHTYPNPSVSFQYVGSTSLCNAVKYKSCECGYATTDSLTSTKSYTTNPSCTTDGKFKCSAGGSTCSYTHTDTGSATGHGNYTSTTTATCTSSGITTVKCGKCGATTGSSAESALGHDWRYAGAVPVAQCSSWCNRCNAECRHSYAQKVDYKSYNATYHDIYNQCPDCGYGSWHSTLWTTGVFASAPYMYKHDKVPTKYTTSNHKLICSLCGYNSGTESHSYPVTGNYDYNKYNSTQHWNECECTYQKTKYNHSFNTSGMCQACGYRK